MSRSTAFTLGYAKSYDRGLTEATVEAPLKKVGRYPPLEHRPDYGGGWVWAMAQEADEFRTSDAFERAFPGRAAEFAVYRLELPTGWETDVSEVPDPTDGVHRLLYDAVIVVRVQKEQT